jgi:5'-nucleotidase domain protein
MQKFKSPIYYFIISLVFLSLLVSCGAPKMKLTEMKAKNFAMVDTLPQVSEIDSFISPFRTRIAAEMVTVLAQNTNDLVKDHNTTALNTGISNLIADAVYQTLNPIYRRKHRKSIDFVLLNWGGIRADLPKGPVTMGAAYSIMPFENEMVVLTMTGEKVKELVDYLIAKRLPHPLSKQFYLQIDQEGNIEKFTIRGKAFNPNATYIVATSDYLLEGGDEMYFFKGAEKVFRSNYKIRNVLIDYFKKMRVIDAKEDRRFEYKP